MKTTSFNVRVDIQDIALLHRYYSTKGTDFPSVSTLTRTAISFLAQSLVSQLGAEPFETIADAVNYLESKGLTKTLRNRSQSLIKALQEESLNLEGISLDYLKRKGQSGISQDQIQRAKEILNQRQEDELDECSGAILGLRPGEIKKGG